MLKCVSSETCSRHALLVGSGQIQGKREGEGLWKQIGRSFGHVVCFAVTSSPYG